MWLQLWLQFSDTPDLELPGKTPLGRHIYARDWPEQGLTSLLVGPGSVGVGSRAAGGRIGHVAGTTRRLMPSISLQRRGSTVSDLLIT
jgi:hypothetical protein